ncbi:MAG: hypothetical protein R3272_13670 [Candidatus Promineifilaceae bacterium]|nr:hypothetical protein [Candidatus Promineifilaceae bacterium]
MIPPDGTITASHFGRLRQRLVQLDVKPTEIDAALGAAANGRTRREIALALRQWLRGRPQAQ